MILRDKHKEGQEQEEEARYELATYPSFPRRFATSTATKRDGDTPLPTVKKTAAAAAAAVVLVGRRA